MIKIGKNISSFSTHSCQPKSNDELKAIINARIAEEGPDCNLNDIDTSLIEDMSYLFDQSKFNGDISKWNVSNVKDMSMIKLVSMSLRSQLVPSLEILSLMISFNLSLSTGLQE